MSRLRSFDGARAARRARKRATGTALWFALALSAMAATGSTAGAYTTHVDGVADQNLERWDGNFESSPFASFFGKSWVGREHIRFARYAVQWNVASGAPEAATARTQFEAWLRDVATLGLTVVLAPTSFNAEAHPSPALYRSELERLLALAKPIDHVAYLEAWNEPNNQGGFPHVAEAAEPARYADEAHELCRRLGCKVIAGDLEDSPNSAAYVREYARFLTWKPSLWGVHPYEAIYSGKEGKTAYSWTNLESYERELRAISYPSPHLWYTEVGAYYRLQSGAGVARPGNAAVQSQDAEELNRLIAQKRPAHVFYYEFMYGDGQNVPVGASDTELYEEGDTARAAAAVIFAGSAAQAEATAPPSPLRAFATLSDWCLAELCE